MTVRLHTTYQFSARGGRLPCGGAAGRRRYPRTVFGVSYGCSSGHLWAVAFTRGLRSCEVIQHFKLSTKTGLSVEESNIPIGFIYTGLPGASCKVRNSYTSIILAIQLQLIQDQWTTAYRLQCNATASV